MMLRPPATHLPRAQVPGETQSHGENIFSVSPRLRGKLREVSNEVIVQFC